MINQNELRNNNWIQRNGLENPFMVNATFIRPIGVEKGVYNYEDFKPIPLTGEWLIKFGFKKYIFGSEEGEKNDKCNEYSKDRLTIMDWGDGFVMNNAFSFDLRVQLKTVHQLQNLFFALTGKELLIK